MVPSNLSHFPLYFLCGSHVVSRLRAYNARCSLGFLDSQMVLRKSMLSFIHGVEFSQPSLLRFICSSTELQGPFCHVLKYIKDSIRVK